MGATMKPSNKESVQDTVARLRANTTRYSNEIESLKKRQSSKCSRAQNRGKQNHQTLIAWRANTGPSAEKSTH